MLQRILAALIFAVIFDLVLFDGRDIDAVKRIALAVVQGCQGRTALGSHFINGRRLRDHREAVLSVLVNCEFWARWIADTFISDLPHKMLASFLCD